MNERDKRYLQPIRRDIGNEGRADRAVVAGLIGEDMIDHREGSIVQLIRYKENRKVVVPLFINR